MSRRFDYPTNNDRLLYCDFKKDTYGESTNEPDLTYSDCGRIMYLDGVSTGYVFNSPIKKWIDPSVIRIGDE